MSNLYPFLPKLTVNGQFIRDFIAAESPCFALGLVEERKQQCGFLALRPDEVIPREISAVGFNFGHALLGTAEFEVIQFAFEFYGFETYGSQSQGSWTEVAETLRHSATASGPLNTRSFLPIT